MGFEHLSLDVDGEVTEAAVLSLPVEAAEHCSLSAGEAHLHQRARGVARGRAAAHFHVQRLHLGEGGEKDTSITDCETEMWFGCYFVNHITCDYTGVQRDYRQIKQCKK